MELLDLPFVGWLLEVGDGASRDCWHLFGSNLAAAVGGHEDLCELAGKAWHSAWNPLASYGRRKAELEWRKVLDRGPTKYETLGDEVPLHVRGGYVNPVSAAYHLAVQHSWSRRYVEAALNYLAEHPGQLSVEARTRQVTPRRFLLDEGYLDER